MRHVLLTTALVGLCASAVLAPAALRAGDEPVMVETPIPPIFAEPPIPPAFVLQGLPADPSDEDEGPGGAISLVAETAATDAIVANLEGVTRFCGAIGDSAYVVDCLAERLEQVALSLPETGDYAEARAAIAQASRSLNDLVAANPSSDLPSGIARSTGTGGQTSRPLRPVATQNLAETVSRAIAIVDEAETVLLRSSPGSDPRQVHYQRIAQAIGSNKVLLRSA